MTQVLDQAWAKSAHEKLAHVVDTISLVHGCLGSIRVDMESPECVAELCERSLLPLFADLDGIVRSLKSAAGEEA